LFFVQANHRFVQYTLQSIKLNLLKDAYMYSIFSLIIFTLFEHGAITLIEDRRIALKCLEMLQIRVRERERGANG